MSYSLFLTDADHTREAGAALGKALHNAHVIKPLSIHLDGELGAGKTTLVSGLLHAMGHVGAVRSPTYTLIEPYEFVRANAATLHVIHMDLYRLTDPSQLEELGLRDMLVANTVLLIEWPSRGKGFLPHAELQIQLEYAGAESAGRRLQINAYSSLATQLLQLVQSQYSTGP